MPESNQKKLELQKEIDKINEDALKAANSDVHLAKELLEKANTLSREISYKKGLARNLYIYGYFYLRTSRYYECRLLLMWWP